MNVFFRSLVLFSLIVGLQVAPAATITLRPTRAGGVEGVDWMLGPGEREISLAEGGQEVEVKVYFSDWAPELVAAYQGTLDCDAFMADQAGHLTAIAVDCTTGEGTFGTDFCLGVNEQEPSYVLGFSGSTLPACGFLDEVCPNGEPGPYACGAVDIFAANQSAASAGGLDLGVEHYAMQFSFVVSADFLGHADVSLLSDELDTFIKNKQADNIPVDLIEPARISVSKGACCMAGPSVSECLDDVTLLDCNGPADFFHAGESCGAVDSDGDGVLDLCDACPGSDDFLDGDNDGVADGCDPCPVDALDDSDGDGVCDSADTCPGSDDNVDSDGDGVADGCDVCPGQLETPNCIQVVPAVSTWGLVVLCLLLMAAAKVARLSPALGSRR